MICEIIVDRIGCLVAIAVDSVDSWITEEEISAEDRCSSSRCCCSRTLLL